MQKATMHSPRRTYVSPMIADEVLLVVVSKPLSHAGY